MSCLHLFALVVLATCGFFCAVHANMEAKRMGSEFLGKRSPSSRLDVADVLPGGFWEEELAARSPAAALRAARLLRAAAGVNRFGGGGAYDNDDDDDLDLAMAAAAAAAKQKRIGSEFLGKRSSTSDLLPKRMGSEFLDPDGALSRSLQQLYAGDSPFARSRGYSHDLDWILGHHRARPSKRLSEFLGGPGKRYSEFLGGPGKRYSEFLGGPGKRYSEFLGGPGKRSVADDVMAAAAERGLLHSSSAEQQESGTAAGSLRK